jgi:hypothetical protein
MLTYALTFVIVGAVVGLLLDERFPREHLANALRGAFVGFLSFGVLLALFGPILLHD